MAIEIERSPEKIHLIKLKKKKKKNRGIDLNPPRRKLSPQTHFFMLNMQVNNQSNLTKRKYYSPVS